MTLLYSATETKSIQKCKYHLTNEEYVKKIGNRTIRRKCNSLKCPKHGPKRRRRLARKLIYLVDRSPYGYFLHLPIGPVLGQDPFTPLWASFTQSIRNNKKLRCDYIFVKEVSPEGIFHLHGIIISDTPLDTNWFCKQWLKFLRKKLAIIKRLQDVEMSLIRSTDATSKYVVKDTLVNKKPGFGVINHRRLILASTGMSEAIRRAGTALRSRRPQTPQIPPGEKNDTLTLLYS